MDIVIKSITSRTAAMVVDSVVNVMSKYSTAQNANALTTIEASLGQIALKQQLQCTGTTGLMQHRLDW